MMKELKGLIFDVDGLLVDTETYYTKSWQMALHKFGKEISDEEVHAFSGLNWRIVGKKLSERYDEELAQKVVAEREVILKQVIAEGKIECKPHAKEVLQKAKEADKKLAVASSGKKERAFAILNQLGLYPYFDYCVFGDDVERNKPYPDAYCKALEGLELEATEAIALEDSLVGAKAATAAGLEVFVVPDQSLPTKEYTKEQLTDINVLEQAKDLKAVEKYL